MNVTSSSGRYFTARSKYSVQILAHEAATRTLLGHSPHKIVMYVFLFALKCKYKWYMLKGQWEHTETGKEKEIEKRQV